MPEDVIAAAVFGLLFETGIDPAFVVHRDSRLVMSANVRMGELLDADCDALIGAELDRLVVAVDGLPVPDLVRYAGRYDDVALARSDGYPVFVTMTIAHVDHVVHGPLVACIARDTTVRRDLERELFAKHAALFAAHRDLERTNHELRVAQRELEIRTREITTLAGEVSRFGRRAAVGELCASVAHHLNNPVGALISTLRRLATKIEAIADPELVRLVTRCREVSARIESNVAMVVRAHRAGDIVDQPNWLVLGREIETALTVFADRLAGIEVSVVHADELAYVPRDSLHHVLSNLIDNSLRAFEPGRPGGLTIAVETRPSAHVITLVDTGPGIASTIVADLFVPLVTARPDGAGLGLSTAQRLARGWGGDLVHVAIPLGTRFDILIPGKEVAS